jgi:hypothetical protein
MRFIAGADFAAREVTRAALAGRAFVRDRRIRTTTPGLAKHTGAVSR